MSGYQVTSYGMCGECRYQRGDRIMGYVADFTDYVEWLEQVIGEFQPDWICDELVCEDGWCENHCKSSWDKECLTRYYNKHFSEVTE